MRGALMWGVHLCLLSQPSLAPCSGPLQLIKLRGGKTGIEKQACQQDPWAYLWSQIPHHLEGQNLSRRVKRGRAMKEKKGGRGNGRMLKKKGSPPVLPFLSGFHLPSQFVGSCGGGSTEHPRGLSSMPFAESLFCWAQVTTPGSRTPLPPCASHSWSLRIGVGGYRSTELVG